MRVPEVVVPPFVVALAERVASATGAEEILLFGSYAKGRANVHSDVDLLVVLTHPPTPALRIAAEDAAHSLPLGVDVHVHGRAELLHAVQHEPCGFLDSILRHAVTLTLAPGGASVLS